MTLVLVLLLVAEAAAFYIDPSTPWARGVLAAAALLFPGTALLMLASVPRSLSRDLLLGPALAPVVLGSVLTLAVLTGASPERWLSALLLITGLVVVLIRVWESPRYDLEHEDADPGKAAWMIGLGFSVAIALVLVPSEWRRVTSDAWFHIAVVHELDRSGIPPQDPYFSGLTLQYFWFFHAVLLAFLKTARLQPAETMALLNIIAAGLCVPAAARIGKTLELPRASLAWGGVVFLLGMGGLFWLFFPIKLLTVFIGEVQGEAAIRDLFSLRPLTPESTTTFATLLHSSSFLLRKFLVGTAASWGLLLILIAADAALRWIRDSRHPDALVLFLSTLGAFLLHVVLGGASLTALFLGAVIVFAIGTAPRGRTLVILLLIPLAFVLSFPYLKSVASAKETENLFPLGVHLWYWISIPITLTGVTVLAVPGIRRLWQKRSAPALLFLGWLGASLGYGLFGRLPGPNQFDKPPLVLYIPLALAAGFAVPLIWQKLAGRRVLRPLFAVFLFMFLVPENGLRYAGFMADGSAPEISRGDRALYAWIEESVGRDAIFLDSADRVDVLTRGPRRQYWGKEAYAYQWGYPVEEMNRRRAVRDAVYGAGSLDRDDLAPLSGLDAPVFVIARESDHPGCARRLQKHTELFRPVFKAPGMRVFRFQAP